MVRQVILILIVGYQFFSPVLAQQTRGVKPVAMAAADTGKIFGIVIGVSEYVNLPSLSYAHKDAGSFYNFLLSLIKSEKEKENISFFINQFAKRDAIAEKLYEINEKAQPGDKVYVYFGGHGDIEHLTQTGNCLLLLGDCLKKNYLRKSDSYLDINLFRDFFQRWAGIGVKTVFICDACHSGSVLSGGEDGRRNTLLSLQQTWKNEIRMLSCQPDEFSLESNQWGGGRGLFSYFLVAGLQGLADSNADSLVSLFEIQKFLLDSVSVYSEQSQIPALSGEIKTALTKYNRTMFAEAKNTIKNKRKPVQGNELALKGFEDNDILETLKDSTSRTQFRKFRQFLQEEVLISPADNCAVSVYNQFAVNETTRIARGYMKMLLINKLQGGFDEMMEYLYDDRFEQYDFIKRFQIESKIAACIKLVGTTHYLYNRMRARQLFLSACSAGSGIQTGVPITGALMDKLMDGIDDLKRGVALDPMAPFLYLMLGDYYLFSRQYQEAIAAYTTYHQLLPNDEYALNKLGMAYFYTQNYKKAADLVVLALRINPGFYKAQSNLQIIKSKM